MPRKKGSKSRTGIPIKGLPDAVELVRQVYEKAQDKEMSFNEMENFMNLRRGSSTPIAGALKEYGLIEKGAVGWKVSDLGKKCLNKEKQALRQAFDKVSIFRDLSSQFSDKEVTEGLIIDYLKSKYRKGDTNIQLITKRFLEGTNYINTATEDIEKPSKKSESEIELKTLIKLIQLKYALTPPQDEKEKLIEEATKDLKKIDDDAISSIAETIEEHKKDEKFLKIQVNTILNILEKKNPDLFINVKESKKKSERKTEYPDSSSEVESEKSRDK